MPTNNNHATDEHDLILTGIHMELTDALKNIAREKTSRLFRHEDRIVRLRVDLEYDKTRAHEGEFVAKGHLEIQGPNLVCSVASDDCLKSLDQMVDKLDRMLRRRARLRKVKRHRTNGAEILAETPEA